MDEQAFERDSAQVRRAPRQLTSREQYRRIPTRAPPGEEDMDEINLEDEQGEESSARQMAQRALQRSRSRQQGKPQHKPEMQHGRLHGTCRNDSGQGTNESLH